MTRKEALLNLGQVLVRRRDALRKVLAGDLSLLKELRVNANDHAEAADLASDSIQDEIGSQLVEVEARELDRVEAALARIQEGTYGTCEGCTTMIPMARLNALPYALLCIECQREAERSSTTSVEDVDWSRLLDSSGDGEDSSEDE